MTIPISEVIEACARVCDEQYPYSVFHTDQRAAKNCAEAIRALAAKYDGCIVAEGEPSAVYKGRDYEYRVPLVDLPRGD
jgi:hypothetical protein